MWQRYENRLLVVLGLSFGCVFFDRTALSYLAPFVIPDLGLNNMQVGLLASALAVTWAISGYVVGGFSDRSGRRKSLLLVSVIVFSVASALSGLAGGLISLLLARLLMGLAEGPVLPITQSLMAAASTPGRRGFNMGTMQLLPSALFSGVVGPLLLVPLAHYYGWRSAFFVAGLPGLVVAGLIAIYVREPSVGAVHEALKSRMPLSELLGFRNIWICLIISALMVTWLFLILIFAPVWFIAVQHRTPEQMGLLMSATGVATGIGGVLVPALSDRIGRKPVLIVFGLIGVVCPLGILYGTGPLLTVGALIFIGELAKGTFPLFMATIPSETIPVRYVATALGLIMGFGEVVGGVIAPVVGGRAADLVGLQAPLLIAAASAGLAGLLAVFLRETAPVKIRKAAVAPVMPLDPAPNA